MSRKEKLTKPSSTPIPYQEYLRPSHKERLRYIITDLTDMILDVSDEAYSDIKEARSHLESAFFKIKDKK